MRVLVLRGMLSILLWLFVPAWPAPVLAAASPAAPVSAASSVAPAVESSARELERRLLAPCCWRETLDVHTSPLTTQLRGEIRARLAAGESSSQIEDDLVARHGPRLRAQLPDSLGIWLVVAICIGGALLLYFFGRSRRAVPAAAKPQESTALTPQDADYEWQLDQDLQHD